MIWQKYKLDNEVLKTNEMLTLWKTENGIVEIDKNAIAIPITSDDARKGYIFHGHGKLLLDTIVETKRGAVGKPVEKEINAPFLMLGEIEKIQQSFSAANGEDLKMMGYKNEQEFRTKAGELFDRFLGRRMMHEHNCCGNTSGFIFALPNSDGKLDVLISNDSKLVYKAADQVFVSSKHKTVLKTQNEVIVSNGQKSLVFEC
ncbi:hypothetical protein HXY33_01105 [Candidatus Bathyarchaeota archaeon]|nr:hypothetical protein [Candidatus Bathyarchaeota archaeon]